MAKPKFSEPSTFIGNALATESDRGCVLAGVGYLEQSLLILLKSKFTCDSQASKQTVDWLLSGPTAPIGTFYVRLSLAHALGLISPEDFEALKKLNALRNHFAHHPGNVSLSGDRVEGILSCLTDRDRATVDLNAEKSREFFEATNFPTVDRSDCRAMLEALIMDFFVKILQESNRIAGNEFNAIAKGLI